MRTYSIDSINRNIILTIKNTLCRVTVLYGIGTRLIFNLIFRVLPLYDCCVEESKHRSVKPWCDMLHRLKSYKCEVLRWNFWCETNLKMTRLKKKKSAHRLCAARRFCWREIWIPHTTGVYLYHWQKLNYKKMCHYIINTLTECISSFRNNIKS